MVVRPSTICFSVHAIESLALGYFIPKCKTFTASSGCVEYLYRICHGLCIQGSVFRDVGLPDVLVSDRDTRFTTRFTSAFWTCLHAALGASFIYGSPHHHNTTSKVEHINGVIADVLRSFAGERTDDWPARVPLVEFAINDSVSPLTRPSMPTAASNPAACLPRRGP